MLSYQVTATGLGDVFVRRKGYQHRLAKSSENMRLVATQTLQAAFRRAHLRSTDTRAGCSAARLQVCVCVYVCVCVCVCRERESQKSVP